MHKSTGIRMFALLIAVCFALAAAPIALASENVAFLTKLTIADGELSESFHSNTYDYLAEPDPGKTSVMLSVEGEPQSVITINGTVATSTSLSIEDGGVRKAVILVEAPGESPHTYTVELIPRSANADLERIGTNDVEAPGESPHTDTEELIPRSANSDLERISTNDVEAPGESPQTDTEELIPLSANSDLERISTNDILVPAFNPAITEYALTPRFPNSNATVVVYQADPAATICINGQGPDSTFRLSADGLYDGRKAEVEVTAADGVTQKTYTFTLADSSSDANLGGILIPNVAGYGMEPSFKPNTTYYEVHPYDDPNNHSGTGSMSITVFPEDPLARIRVNGKAAPFTDVYGSYTFVLGTVNNYVTKATIEVTSADGTAKKTYTVVYLDRSMSIGAPSLSAAPFGYNAARISWGALTRATAYEVYRANSSTGTYTKIADVSGTSYMDSGLVSGKTYYYKVRGRAPYTSSQTFGPYSSVKSVKPAWESISLKLTATYKSVQLAWNAAAQATGYEVQRASSSKGPYTTITRTSEAVFTDTAVAAGKKYYYRVRPYDDANGTAIYGPYTSYKSAAPAWPSITLKTISGGYERVQLSWNAVSGATGYEVYRALSSKGPYALITKTGDTSFADTGLVTGKTYYYKVRPYDDANGTAIYGPYTSYKSAAPAWPSITLKAASDGYDTVQLSWNAVSGATGYEVYRALSSKGPYALITKTGDTSFADTGLVTGKTYYYKVRPYDDANGVPVYGPYTSYKSAAPAWPSVTLKAVSGGYERVQLSWNAASGATGYEVYRALSSKGPYALITKTGDTSFADTGLVTGKTYYYKVRPYDDANGTPVYGPYTSYKSAAPVWPAITLKAASDGYDTVRLSWSTVFGATGYEVYRSSSSKGSYALIARTGGTGLTDGNLVTGKTYYYKVRPYDDANGVPVYGPYTSYKSAAPQLAAPMLDVQMSFGSISLVWSRVKGATGYEVYRATSAKGSFTKMTDTDGIGAQYDNPTAKTYYFKVRAYTLVDKTRIYGVYSETLTFIK